MFNFDIDECIGYLGELLDDSEGHVMEDRTRSVIQNVYNTLVSARDSKEV